MLAKLPAPAGTLTPLSSLVWGVGSCSLQSLRVPIIVTGVTMIKSSFEEEYLKASGLIPIIFIIMFHVNLEPNIYSVLVVLL